MPSLDPTLKRCLMLAKKDTREILASRAYWLMLALLGPLVGHAFLTAVETYAEASRGGALPQGLSPLDGILVPTWGAYDLAATLFFPFVCIRLVADERERGAWSLLLQGPEKASRMLGVKFAVLQAAWMVAWIPGFIAMLMWRGYGGHINALELGNLLTGYALRGALTIAVAMAAAAVSRGAASAAIVCLGFTVGSWALDFAGAVHGGWIEKAAAFTPTNALRSFETGLFAPSKVLLFIVASEMGLALATIWMRLGWRARQRVIATAIMAVVFGIVAVAIAGIPASMETDVSEDRRNSFPPADQALLATIHDPLRVTVHLAPEDPRLTDLERNVLAKLARAMPDFEEVRTSESRTGLFDRNSYGEIWYELAGKRTMSRSTTEAVVLEVIYKLAGKSPPPRADALAYSGYPLDAQPRFVTPLLIVLWPALIAAACWFTVLRRRA